ncbi:hypothetical protein [Pedobacter cryoconitis]|nr:hypothetical protein [Pedobacter cryoconitis]
MKNFYNLLRADYLQRTRSYSFLITLVFTVYMAYLFVPLHSASYTTLNVPGFKGAYNSAWAGYVSAIMTTVMLSMYGFLLVNSGIKKDIDTEVGLIIACTPISDFSYLLSKMLSNLMVLLTIVCCTFVVSIIMFFMRGSGYAFVLANFVVPYLILAVPAMFLVASLAVLAEVFLGKKNVLQFLIYFMLFGITMAAINSRGANNLMTLIDPFGLKTITSSIAHEISSQFHTDIQNPSFGFIFSGQKPFKVFIYEGIHWQLPFLISRLLWVGVSILLVYFSSFFFHRFDFKQTAVSKKPVAEVRQTNGPNLAAAGINRSLMPPVVTDYSIFPFVKTELLLLIRKGNKWFWLVNIGLWLAMCFAPLAIAHAYLLPVLWFLQVTRWSDLATKEKTNRLHYFTFAAYRPLFRILPAQILSGVILAIAMALPLLLRYAIAADLYSIVNLINGAVLVIVLAVAIGIITGGKKLYEIIFFMLTYAVINKLSFADYLGSMVHGNRIGYIVILTGLNAAALLLSFMVRSYQSRHL